MGSYFVAGLHTRASEGKATMAGSRSKQHAEQKIYLQEGMESSAAKTQAVHRHSCNKDTADSVDWEAVRVAPTERVRATPQIAQS